MLIYSKGIQVLASVFRFSLVQQICLPTVIKYASQLSQNMHVNCHNICLSTVTKCDFNCQKVLNFNCQKVLKTVTKHNHKMCSTVTKYASQLSQNMHVNCHNICLSTVIKCDFNCQKVLNFNCQKVLKTVTKHNHKMCSTVTKYASQLSQNMLVNCHKICKIKYDCQLSQNVLVKIIKRL